MDSASGSVGGDLAGGIARSSSGLLACRVARMPGPRVRKAASGRRPGRDRHPRPHDQARRPLRHRQQLRGPAGLHRGARLLAAAPRAEALVRAPPRPQEKGYGLLIFDGYRPWTVTKLFWDVTPRSKVSSWPTRRRARTHNRGCAVDLSLYDRKSGKEVQMPSAYDEMSPRAYPATPEARAEERAARRDLLRPANGGPGLHGRGPTCGGTSTARTGGITRSWISHSRTSRAVDPFASIPGNRQGREASRSGFG
jgi:hypothetical protein